MCALRWDQFDAGTAVLVITTSVAQRGGRTWEKNTKTHQQRRIALDAQTVALLVAYRRHCAERAGLDDMPGAARILSPLLDGAARIKPDTVGQRYERMCTRIGWDKHIHQLRHYSTTELIEAGVDVRTVAGRLDHGGGGTTTLKVYSALSRKQTNVPQARSLAACQLPTVDELAARYCVSHGTAQRAIAVLRTAGLVAVRRGQCSRA